MDQLRIKADASRRPAPVAAPRLVREPFRGPRRAAIRVTGIAAIAALTGWLAVASAVVGAEPGWPHWRGPERNGVSPEASGWNGREWPLREAWVVETGRGASSVVAHQQRVYALGWEGKGRGPGHDIVACLDARTGAELWRQRYASPLYGRFSLGDQGLYAGVCGTPELDADAGLLFTLGIDGDLCAWRLEDGRRLWHTNLYDAYHAPQRPRVGRSGHRDYGYTSSPLVWGETLIVEAGSPTAGCLIGLNKRTGQLLWGSQDKSFAGHNAGPALIEVAGVPCVAVHNHSGLLVARLDAGQEGRTVATHPWVTDFANNIAAVCVHGDSVLLTSSYNHHKIARLRISLEGAKVLWSQDAASKVCTPVVSGGRVYWAWQQLHCLDFETGRVLSQTGRHGDPGSCLITADRKLIVWSGSGDLSLHQLEASPQAPLRQLAARPRLSQTDAWPHVALAEGRLYCRDREGRLRCFIVDGG